MTNLNLKRKYKSDFQEKVLTVVSAIPKGEVMNYEQVAMLAGNVKAVRAVATAIAKNPYPIEVPCHRVIRKNGFVGDYLFGREKKLLLLKNEGVKFNEDGYLIKV